MAFQANKPFFAFLQETAGKSNLDEVAPSENYILDERLPDVRGDSFLAFNGFVGQTHDRDLWFQQHANYCRAHVALPSISETFSAINNPNWLALSPDWDVVRIETIYGLAGRARSSSLSEAEVIGLIDDMLKSRAASTPFDTLKQAQLEKWIRQVSSGSDRRPAFVAPYAEVEDILNQPDWANRLRDALGLGHIRPWAGNPMPVVLLQYNLVRVHDAHIGKPAWAASPTVLDDVPGQMPNPCFFPAPKKASSDGYGFTVDLGSPWVAFRKELLHGHIAYTLADVRRIGEITTDVPTARIVDARKDHLELLKDDLGHVADLPAKP
ncbi:MAG: hypothetical protein Q8Q73_03850 [Stagnimonas sp.]|nr:hypothetical protein [Stagnimonas sp.]